MLVFPWLIGESGSDLEYFSRNLGVSHSLRYGHYIISEKPNYCFLAYHLLYSDKWLGNQWELAYKKHKSSFELCYIVAAFKSWFHLFIKIIDFNWNCEALKDVDGLLSAHRLWCEGDRRCMPLIIILGAMVRCVINRLHASCWEFTGR